MRRCIYLFTAFDSLAGGQVVSSPQLPAVTAVAASYAALPPFGRERGVS